jgi:hypothetical protein
MTEGGASHRSSIFKAFIDQNQPSHPILSLDSLDPFGTEIVSPLENSFEPAEFVSNVHDEAFDSSQGWTQYLDDETGHLYWYNIETGEARWLTEEEMNLHNYHYENSDPVSTKEKGTFEYALIDSTTTPSQKQKSHKEIDETANQFPQSSLIVTDILAGPWEKYYDDDGNPFYYNKETGLSEWEIPADQLQFYSHPQYDEGLGFSQDQPQHDSLYHYPLGGEENPSGSSQKSVALNDGSPSFKNLSSKNLSFKTTSFRSVRSARSLGLLLPRPVQTEEGHHPTTPKAANSVSFDAEATRGGISKSGKLAHKLSFSIKKSPSVDNSLKPKTPSPIKRKTKNGFQMLKEGASIISKGKDDNEQIWIEYQTAEEGPIFYAIEDTEGGQWNRPATYQILDLISSNIGVNDDASSVGDHSVELVDNLSEGLLTIKTPINNSAKMKQGNSPQESSSSPDKSSAARKSVEGRVGILSVVDSPLMRVSSFEDPADHVGPIIDPIKLMSKSYVKLGIGSIVRTASSQNMKSPEKDMKASLQDPAVKTQAKAVLDTFTNRPSPDVNLKIKNIQAEAMIELQKLRDKLNQAKKDFKSSTPPAVIPVTVNPPQPLQIDNDKPVKESLSLPPKNFKESEGDELLKTADSAALSPTSTLSISNNTHTFGQSTEIKTDHSISSTKSKDQEKNPQSKIVHVTVPTKDSEDAPGIGKDSEDAPVTGKVS